MPRLDRLGFRVLGSARAAVSLRVEFSRVVQTGTASPLDVLLQHVHVVDRVEHAEQDEAREKHVVDALLLAVGYGELHDSQAALQDAGKALYVLAHALQRRGKDNVVFEYRIARLYESHPLRTRKYKGGGKDGEIYLKGWQAVGQTKMHVNTLQK